jgi:hypothetical protein
MNPTFSNPDLLSQIKIKEMGHLLESHLLKETAQHQNVDCSMPKENETAQKSKKV